jgi:hypothetical protein
MPDGILISIMDTMEPASASVTAWKATPPTIACWQPASATTNIVTTQPGLQLSWPLVARGSFLKMILLVYGKDQLMSQYPGIAFGNDRYRLQDIGSSLLGSAYDCCHERFHAIADTLLQL